MLQTALKDATAKSWYSGEYASNMKSKYLTQALPLRFSRIAYSLVPNVSNSQVGFIQSPKVYSQVLTSILRLVRSSFLTMSTRSVADQNLLSQFPAPISTDCWNLSQIHDPSTLFFTVQWVHPPFRIILKGRYAIR